MTNATFFELQRARVASTSDALSEAIRKQQFARASHDPGDHSPMPYRSPHSKAINTTIGNHMKYRIRID